jgi:hypothetical protein
LNWKNLKGGLENILNELLYLQFPQTIQYIRITFDAIFSIMSEKEEFQESTFLTLIQILEQFSKKQYSMSRSVIQQYFDNHFNFPEVYKVLLKYSIHYLSLDENNPKKNKLISATLKNLKFLVNGIVKSRIQFEKKNEGNEKELNRSEFIEGVKHIMKNLNEIIILEEKSIQPAQDVSLKLLENMFDYVSTLVGNETGELINSLIETIPSSTGRRGLLEGKLFFMSFISKSSVMMNSEIRDNVLPVLVKQLMNHFNQSIPETKLCITVLSNILSSIQDLTKYTNEEIRKMIHQVSILLPEMCISCRILEEEQDQVEKKKKMTNDENEKNLIQNDLDLLEIFKGDLTSCFLCIFYYSNEETFEVFRKETSTNIEMFIPSFLKTMLNLIVQNPIPIYWISFNVFHYKTMITCLNFISSDFLKYYSKKNFNFEVWSLYFENLYQFIL